jgi:hypothetical protein
LGSLSTFRSHPNYAVKSTIIRELAMLDLMLENPRRYLNEIVTLAEPGNTKRAVTDRRAAAAGKQAPLPLLRKRRRHDCLDCAKQAPLVW